MSYQMSGLSIALYLCIYLYFAYTMMVIANKTKTPNSWMAWVPILNLFLMVKVAGKSYWWILLLLIPIVNAVVAVYLWMEISRRRGFSSYLGLLLLIPILGTLFLPAYVAFAEPPKGATV